MVARGGSWFVLRPRSPVHPGSELAGGGAPLWQYALAALLLAWVALMLTLALIGLSKSMRRGRIRATGIRATARVESLTRLGWTRNRNPGARLTLLVTPPDGPPYPATVEAAIPQLHVPRVQPGGEIPVAIDPRDRSMVVLDLDRG
jgi:hypothetical protein